jgi:DME family drug/metabolite transporter
MPAARSDAAPFPRELPYFAILLAVFAWGLGPLFVRAVPASPITISFWRLWIATPFTMAIAWFSGSPLTLRALRASILPGALFGLSILFAFASFQKTSLANATLIAALQPVLVLFVAGRLFGERVGRREIVLAATSLFGIALVVFGANGGGGSDLVGDLFAVANLIVFTAYFLVIKQRRSQGYGAAALLCGGIFWSAVLVTPVALVTDADLGAIQGGDWVWIALMVLIPGTIGHGIMNWAQRYVDVTISSLLTLLNPVVTTVGAWLVYDQVLNGVQVAGAGIVLVSLGLIVLAHHRYGEVVAEEPL